MLDLAQWADAGLLAGGMGRNSETAATLEDFTRTFKGLLIVAHDSVDYFVKTPQLLCSRPDTIIVCSIAQLQKIYINLPSIVPITYGMNMHQLVDALHSVSQKLKNVFVTLHAGHVFVAHQGYVTTYPYSAEQWRVRTAATISPLALQNKGQLYQAVVSGLTGL